MENGDYVLKAYSISVQGKNAPIAKKAPVQTALFAALKCGVDEGALENFTIAVNSGFYDGNKQSAAMILRNYLLERHTRSGGAVASNKLCSIAQMAIQDFVNCKPRKML